MTGAPVASETLTVGNTVKALTSTVYRAHLVERKALIEVIGGQDIYYRLDSATATPTSSDHAGLVGMKIECEHPSRFGAIRQGAVDATIKVTYFED